MPKTLRVLLILTAMLILAGCIVQSVDRFYTEASVCAIPSITGEWRLLDDKGLPGSGKAWIFQGDKVVTYEKNNTQANVKTIYFKLGDTFFMDSTADEPAEGANHWWTMHVFPVHVVSKIEIQDNRMTLTPVDYRWLEKAIRDRVVTLPHIRPKEGDSMLFTASPEEWSGFLKKYAVDSNVFSGENAIRFIR
ncbi:MAG: hypothetical protein WA610_06115 [Thermodesulfovibrionales bacterium]